MKKLTFAVLIAAMLTLPCVSFSAEQPTQPPEPLGTCYLEVTAIDDKVVPESVPNIAQANCFVGGYVISTKIFPLTKKMTVTWTKN